MKFLEFLRKVADLVLLSDEASKEWVKEDSIRRTWYALCGLLLVTVFGEFLTGPFEPNLETSVNATLIYRVSNLGLFSLALITAVTLAVNYYRFCIVKHVKILFDNIIFFYITITALFGIVYHFLYMISPKLFFYDNPPFVVGPIINSANNLTVIVMRFHFIMFSAFQSVNGSFYRIHADSVLVSILVYVQSALTIGLIALFLAAYVNQRAK
jgi:hypothetical protein